MTTLSSSSSLSVPSPSSVANALSGQTHVTASGLLIGRLPNSDLNYVQKYVGERNVPADVKRTRRSVFDVMRRMGTPVIIKHMWSDRDRKDGIAIPSPNFDDVYGHTRNNDPISHGVGFVSKAVADDEWIDTSTGNIVTTDTGTPAPKYRGYGPGYLTWIIEPDVTEDFYKHDPTGLFIRVQQAQAQAPWWPDINDNDLIMHVVLDRAGNVLSTRERYKAKMTNPVSLRGVDRGGRIEYGGDFGNRHVVNQTFEMALLPREDVGYRVEYDR